MHHSDKYAPTPRLDEVDLDEVLSRLYRVDREGAPIPLSGSMQAPIGPSGLATAAALSAFVAHNRYPCVGAKSALARGSCIVGLFGAVLDGGAGDWRHRDQAVLDSLVWFGSAADHIDDDFATFIAVYDAEPIDSDEAFETFLWERLQGIHDLDNRLWDDDVMSDPQDPNFRFSAGGYGYFVVGLHPLAAREARRFPYPTLVFNLHRQFEALRRDARFDKMRTTIREREASLAGSPNPYLADHGIASEAHQYAGIPHGPDWRPSFRPRASECPFSAE